MLLLEYLGTMYNPDDATAGKLKAIIAERKQILQTIQNYSLAGDIFSLQRILLRKRLYCRTQKEKNELTALIKPLLKTSEKDMLSRTALGLRNMALCDYYMAIGLPKKAFEISRVYVELRRSAGSFDKVDTQTISEYAQHLWLSIRSGSYEELQDNLDQYKLFLNKIRNKDKHAMGYERWLVYSLIYYLKIGALENAMDLLNAEKIKWQAYEKSISKKGKISFWYFSAYLHYARQDFKIALKLIQKIINDASDDVEEFIFAKLLLMFIHYDLKNYELLEYQARSAQRIMGKKDRLYQCEKIVLNFFKSVTAADSKKVRHQRLVTLQQEVNILFKTPYEKGFSYYFDIQAWIESQLSNRPFSSFLK